MEQKICLILPENLWNVIENYNEYSLEKTLEKHQNNIKSVCVTPNGKQVISCSRDETIRIWDLKTWDSETWKCERISKKRKRWVTSVCVTPDGKRIISGSLDCIVEIRDLEKGDYEQILRGHHGTIKSVCVRSNGKQIISGSVDNSIKIWNLKTGKCEKTLREHIYRVNSVCVTPNKRSDFDRERNSEKIISGSSDKTIKIWDLETGKCEKTLRGHNGWVTSVCVTSNKRSDFDREGNSEKIISGSEDDTIKIWDLKSGKCEKTLRGHNHYVNSVCVTPNSKQIISGSEDNTIKIWDLKTGELLQTLKGHTDYVNCVCVHPNSKKIISGSCDKTIKIWTNRIFDN